MSFQQWNLILSHFTRLFFLVVIFAVLWVKEYLWWAFGLAVLLYGASVFLSMINIEAARRSYEEDEGDYDPDEEEDSTPPRPFRSRPE